VKKQPKRRWNGKRRTATLGDLVRAGEAVVLAMNALAAATRR